MYVIFLREKWALGGRRFMMDEIVREIAEGFSINVTGYSKSKASCILDTNYGQLIMKKQVDTQRVEAAHRITELLYGKGFGGAERYVTANGKPYVFVKEGTYTLSSCGSGAKCNLADNQNVILAAKALARLQSVCITQEEGEGVAKAMEPGYYSKRISEARRAKKWLDGRGSYTDIDVHFIRKYSEYIDSAVTAAGNIERLASGAAPRISFREIKDESVFIDDAANVTLLNFESCVLAPPNTDLCLLIRRFVKKGGDPEFVSEIIASYGEEKSLSEEDIEYIKAYLAFPHKFFSLTNKYYNSRRAFDNHYVLTKLKTEALHYEKIRGILNSI